MCIVIAGAAGDFAGGSAGAIVGSGPEPAIAAAAAGAGRTQPSQALPPALALVSSQERRWRRAAPPTVAGCWTGSPPAGGDTGKQGTTVGIRHGQQRSPEWGYPLGTL
jgi:hypothetical protein